MQLSDYGWTSGCLTLPVIVVYGALVSAPGASCFNLLCSVDMCVSDTEGEGAELVKQCLFLMTDSSAVAPPHSTEPVVSRLTAALLVVNIPTYSKSINKVVAVTLPVLHHFPHCSHTGPCPKVSVVGSFLLFNNLVCGGKKKSWSIKYHSNFTECKTVNKTMA